MWTNEYTTTTPLPPSQVWRALRALHEGTLTYEGADTFELHGPFAVGSTVTVTPVGQDSFESTIVDLVEDQTYADRTDFGSVVLMFRHTLVPADGGTRVTHRLEISGADADDVGPELGPQIIGDFPESMAALLVAAGHER